MNEWKNLTNEEIQYLNKDIPIIIPIGLIEAHGPHMTVNFDNESANYFALEIAKNTNVILAPMINYGFADTNWEYPGTIGLKARTLTLLIRDVCEMFCFHGFNKIIVLSGHGGNKAPCELAFYEVWEKYEEFKPVYWNWWAEAGITGIHHADKGETEVALAIGSQVYMDRAKDYIVDKPWYKERSRYRSMRDSGGINGYPTQASLEEGKNIRDKVINVLSEKLVSIIND